VPRGVVRAVLVAIEGDQIVDCLHGKLRILNTGGETRHQTKDVRGDITR